MERRHFVAGCVTATAVVLAGCGNPGDDEDGDTEGGDGEEGDDDSGGTGGYDLGPRQSGGSKTSKITRG